MEYLRGGYRGDRMKYKQAINKDSIVEWTLSVTIITVYMIYVYMFWQWVDVTAPGGYTLNIIPVDATAFAKAIIPTIVTTYPLVWLYKKKYGGDGA